MGEDSIRQAGTVTKLISELGGEPQYGFEVFGQMVDIDSFLLDLMEKEKTALSLFQQAKSVIESSQVKGIRGKLKVMVSLSPSYATGKSKIIRTLDQLVNDDKNHIIRFQNIISVLGIATKK